MASAINKLEDGTIKLTITVPLADLKKARDEVVEELTKGVTLPGFRKGKAPKKLVEEKLDQDKIKEEVLKKVLPKGYTETVKEHNLRPIINPKIHIIELDTTYQKDWQFEAFTCEMPEIALGNYKDGIKKVTAKTKIIIPGKQPQEPNMEDLMKTLLESVTVKIPKILADGEVERLLSQMLDEVKKLGLTLDQYLASTGKTPEILRKEYEEKAINDITLEFALQKIAGEEKITVEEKEIEEAIRKAPEEAERKRLEDNRYLLASILRQQKTLDFLKNL